MTALAAARNTAMRQTLNVISLAVAAGQHIYPGAMVCLNSSGYAVKGSASTTLLCVGRAAEEQDNTSGANGDLNIRVDRGVFLYANSAAADAIAQADVGKRCYIVDDQTVAKTDGFNARSVAGRIEGLETGGVWVALGEGAIAGVGKIYLPVKTLDLKNADGGKSRLVSPVAGRVTGLRGVIDVAVTGADATVTPKINTVAITGMVLTAPLAASAIGAAYSATAPTALNTVAAGDVLSFETGGGGTQTGNIDLLVEITLS